MFERSAASLEAARRSRVPVAGLEELRRRKGLENAYRVQEIFGKRHGSRAIGYKVGAASKRSQEVVGATEPFYGLLFAADTYRSGATVRRRDFFEPGMEGEFAFRIGTDIDAARAPFTLEDMFGAVDAVLPAIEICDTRFKAWRSVTLEEIVADNAFHGALVLGQPVADWRRFDYLTHEIALSFDRMVVGRGPGALVLGHPLQSVLWLANALAAHGKFLKNGDIVAAGTCTGLHYSTSVKNVAASLGEIGSVSFDIE